MRYKSLFVILWILLSHAVSWGACTGSSPIWNSTPDYASVNTCVQNASVGDTIYVSAGTAIWNSTLMVRKGVNLIGAGKDSTTIECGSADPLMEYLPANESLNAQWEVAGFSLDSNNTCTVIALGEYNYEPTTLQTKVKIHDNNIYGTTSANSNYQYIMNYNMGGVVYNNTFTGKDQQIRSLGFGRTGLFGVVENEWGSSNALYIEDNVFNMSCQDGDYIADCQYSGVKRVWRYNSFHVNCNVSWSGFIDVHGYADTDQTSCYGDEIYGNQGVSSSNEEWAWVAARGGKNAVFYNDVTTNSSVSPGIYYCYGCAPTYKDAQQLKAYFWNNRKNLITNAQDGTRQCGPECPFACDGTSNYPAEDRQVFNFEPSFNGSSGVGCGPALPNGGDASGYLEGTGFWVTSQSCSNLTGLVGPNPNTPISGTLYTVVGGSWVKLYNPYTYPHPLREASSLPAPSPPTNLRIITPQ